MSARGWLYTKSLWALDRAAWRIIVPRTSPEYSDSVVMRLPEPLDEVDAVAMERTAQHIVDLHNESLNNYTPEGLLMIGDPISGTRLVGPFPTEAHAAEFATANIERISDNWCTGTMLDPSNF